MRDQVTQLVGASETDADLGFMARLLALCSLPRTNPGNRLQPRSPVTEPSWTTFSTDMSKGTR